MVKKIFPVLAVVCALCLVASAAWGSGGITEFEEPAFKVMNTLTGTWAKYFSIIMMAITGVTFILKREELSGGFKMLLSIVFGISFIAYASSIVSTLFGFKGALL